MALVSLDPKHLFHLFKIAQVLFSTLLPAAVDIVTNNIADRILISRKY